MATQDEIERLVGKLLLDPAFRRVFLDNPEAAAGDLSIRLDKMQLAHVKEFKENEGQERLEQMAGELASIKSGLYAWG